MYIENPIQIKYTKAGKIKSIDIDWMKLRLMMNFKDDFDAAKYFLRGVGKGLMGPNKNISGRLRPTVNDRLHRDFTLIDGRKYDNNIVETVGKGLDLNSDEAINLMRLKGLKRTQKQLVNEELHVSTLEFSITVYVKGSESNIDTARNNLASAIETALETDITRNGNALDTEVISIETDAGSLFPYGAVLITVRVIYEHQAATP